MTWTRKSLWKSVIEYGILSIRETNKAKQRKPGEAVMQRLKPLNDFIFGRTFGEKGDEEQLLSLLNAILAKTKHKKLVNIEIVEHRTFTAEVVGDKTSTSLH